jgi:hypothetical protein
MIAARRQLPERYLSISASISASAGWFAVLAPRAVLVTDFTVPESPQSEGDGKNLAPLPHHLRCCTDSYWQSVAFLPPSSFGSRYEGQTTKALPRKASHAFYDAGEPKPGTYGGFPTKQHFGLEGERVSNSVWPVSPQSSSSLPATPSLLLLFLFIR